MKINAFAILIAGALLAFSCQKAPVTPEVSLSSEETTLTGGSATLKVSLSSALETDVIVTLKASSETIEPERITLPQSIIIMAGNKVTTAQVTVNDLGLGAGTHTIIISIASAGGANISATARSVTFIMQIADRTASISLSGPAEFKNGVAELELTPSVAPQADITVTLEVIDMQESWRKVLPASALNVPETAVLPIGQKTPTKVRLELKADALPPQDYQLVVGIADVSQGGVIGTDNQLTISAKGAISYSSQTGWKISHYHREKVNRVECDIFNITFSGGKSSGFYVFDDSKEFINQFTSVTDYFSYLVQAIMVEKDGEYSYEHHASQAFSYDIIPYRTGEPFQITMLGCDQDGFPTGEYKMLSMAIGISDYAIEHYYDRWIGTWKTPAGETWTISADDRSRGFYKVTGIKGMDYVIGMDLKNDGSLQLCSQKVGDGAYLFGHFDQYYVESYRPIAEAKWSDDGVIFEGLAVNQDYDFDFCMVHDRNRTTWPVLIDFVYPDSLFKQ